MAQPSYPPASKENAYHPIRQDEESPPDRELELERPVPAFVRGGAGVVLGVLVLVTALGGVAFAAWLLGGLEL